MAAGATEFRTIRDIVGPLLYIDGVKGVGYGEVAEVLLPGGAVRRGKVLDVQEERALVQVFEGTSDIDPGSTRVRFSGRGLEMGLSPDLLGRVFDGFGRPRDGGPAPIPEKRANVNGVPMNPFARDFPNEFVQTGISAIDVLNPLVRGQKLPIFSGSGLPHNRLAAQIARQATTRQAGDKFGVVFAAMGITFEESRFFLDDFERSGALERSVLFMNLADDPAIERISVPRFALTCAEYLAFELGLHVVVILTDMTNYCEALREISAARKEVPGRRGYPGYLYTDLSTLYERAGRIKGRDGSITQIPLLTMPEDDKTHPVPDLSGYITEGQIILGRPFHTEGLYPPVDVLPSLSRLKDKGIGKGKTREDHADVMNQLYACYARGKNAQELAVVLGESSLTPLDLSYVEFARRFEREFVAQGADENRDVASALDLGWKLLALLPKAELKRVRPHYLETYYPVTKEPHGQEQ